MKILVVSDFHCGSLLGLTPPEFRAEFQGREAQVFWDFFASRLKHHAPYDAAIFNGDMVDGPGHRDSAMQLTTDMHRQTDMAVRCIEEAMQHTAGKPYLVRGTGYHTDMQCSFETFVADAMKTEAHDELRLEVNGRRIHSRHVVGRSDIPYGQYTQLAKEQINDLLQADFEDYEDADILIRSHVHYCVGTRVADGSRGIMREAITTPALQLRGPAQSSFVRRLRTWLYHVGITILEISEDGTATITPDIFPIKLYQKREYECLTQAQAKNQSRSRSRKSSGRSSKKSA